MQLSAEQSKALKTNKPCYVIGGPGTGKTILLVERARRLIQSGVKPDSIYIACFSYRSYLHLDWLIKQTLGKEGEGLHVGTFRDFALQELERGNQPKLKIADGVVVRRNLRKAMHEVGFEGTVGEAEHIIRDFKARARKPDENEPYFDLMKVYKVFMDQDELVDRYDVVRQHIIAMANDTAQPCPAKHMLVDNIQDATQIQLYWLGEHLKTGTQLFACGNDDQCIFKRDGALGQEVFESLSGLDGINIQRFYLTQNYRNPAVLDKPLAGIINPIRHRLDKELQYVKNTKNQLKTFEAASSRQEIATMIKRVKAASEKHKQARIGVVVRRGYQAFAISRALTLAGVKHAGLYRSIWEAPGAILMMDFMETLLNTASDSQLRNVLVGMGLNTALVDALFTNGVVAQDWLKNGALLPDGIDLPNSTLQEYAPLQRKLVGLYTAMVNKETNPRKVFKAGAHDLLDRLSNEDKRDALFALEILTSLKGNLKEALPALKKDRVPNVNARIIIAPAREVRNMEFDILFLPLCNSDNWPYDGYKTLPADEGTERRLLYLALSRAKGDVAISYHKDITPFLTDLPQ